MLMHKYYKILKIILRKKEYSMLFCLKKQKQKKH